MARKFVLSLTASVLGSAALLGACGREDPASKIPRTDDGMPIFDLRQPTPTSEYGSQTEVASMEPRQTVQVLLPSVEFEIFAAEVTLYSPMDRRDLTKPRTEPNPNPINRIEFGIVTTDDVGEVFEQIDRVIDTFGVDASAQVTLADIRTTLETTSAQSWDKSNVFTSGLRETDDYQVYVLIRRFNDDRLRLTVTVAFNNGVYDGNVGLWPVDE